MMFYTSVCILCAVCFYLKVFQDAIQSPKPAFRYFTGEVVPPLTKLKVTEPDGSRYISMMSKIIFSTEEQWIPLFFPGHCFIFLKRVALSNSADFEFLPLKHCLHVSSCRYNFLRKKTFTFYWLFWVTHYCFPALKYKISKNTRLLLFNFVGTILW